MMVAHPPTLANGTTPAPRATSPGAAPDRAPRRPAPEAAAGPEVVTLRTPAERSLAELWRRVLRVEHVGPHDDFFDLGGDSLAVVELFTLVEQTFGCAPAMSVILEASTVAAMAARLAAAPPLPAAGPEGVVALRQGTRQPPLFCLPGLGAHLLSLGPVAKHLDPDRTVYGLQYPGQDLRGEPLATVEALAAVLADRILQVQPAGPYCLFGHSFGGMVAYETARQLHERGREVGLLAVGDTELHACLRPKSPARRVGVHLKQFLGRDLRGKLDYLAGCVRRRARLACHGTDPAREPELERVASRLVAVSQPTGSAALPPPEVATEQALRAIRIMYQAARAYRPRPYPGRITYLKAADTVRPEWQQFWVTDPRVVWGALAPGRLDIRSVPGDHLTVLNEPHAAATAAVLEELLATTEQPAGAALA